MAWTTPATQTTGIHITAAVWNEQITDNFAFLGTTHDHNGGAGDGGAMAFVPPGAIAIFDVDCPSGWTRVSAWDGKFSRGAASYGGSGGAATHTHDLPNHTHTTTNHAHTAPTHAHTVGSHTHVGASHTHTGQHRHLGIVEGASNTGTAAENVNAAATTTTTDAITANTENATPNLAAGGTGIVTGSNGACTTGTADNLPAYIDVIFCKKN